MYLIKVDEDNYINIDKIINVSIDKDCMYVFTSDKVAHEVIAECRPVIQRWIDVANERVHEEDMPIKKRNKQWGDGIEPLCVKGVWKEGMKAPEEKE